MGGRVADGGAVDPWFADPALAAGRVQLGRHAVAGYFLEEVLSLQPPEVVEFMLATSVLDELSVPACTAVCGQGSAKMLEFLYGAHMFVAIVDEQAGTYRYHQLIREVLQTELHARDPMLEKRLHEAAARYLMEAGQTGAAARHLLAAGEQAAAVQPAQRRGRARRADQPDRWQRA